MAALADGELRSGPSAPRITRLNSAGRRHLLILSHQLHVEPIHFNGSKRVCCQGGPPHCSDCLKFRRVVYGYVYALTGRTVWNEVVPLAKRVEPDPPHCIHELTATAAEELLALAEALKLETLRGLSVFVSRSKGGQFGRMHVQHDRDSAVKTFASPIAEPDIQYLLRCLYYKQGRLQFPAKGG
jgi:hypothetical protein